MHNIIIIDFEYIIPSHEDNVGVKLHPLMAFWNFSAPFSYDLPFLFLPVLYTCRVCLSVTDGQYILVSRLQSTVSVCVESDEHQPPALPFDDDYYSTLFHTRLESPLSSNAVEESNGHLNSMQRTWMAIRYWLAIEREHKKESNEITDQ